MNNYSCSEVKFMKVMFGTKSGASDFEYKLNEINVADSWNQNETEPDKMSMLGNILRTN